MNLDMIDVRKGTKYITGTTSASGNISLKLNPLLYGVLGVQRVDAKSVCIPYANRADDIWCAKVLSIGRTMEPVASSNVKLEVDYYIRTKCVPNDEDSTK